MIAVSDTGNVMDYGTVRSPAPGTYTVNLLLSDCADLSAVYRQTLSIIARRQQQMQGKD